MRDTDVLSYHRPIAVLAAQLQVTFYWTIQSFLVISYRMSADQTPLSPVDNASPSSPRGEPVSAAGSHDCKDTEPHAHDHKEAISSMSWFSQLTVPQSCNNITGAKYFKRLWTGETRDPAEWTCSRLMRETSRLRLCSGEKLSALIQQHRLTGRFLLQLDDEEITKLVDADVELFQDVKKLVQRLQVRKKRVISTVKICLPKLKDLFSELSISDPTSGSFAGESFREVPPAITDDGIEQAAGSFQGDCAPGIHLDSSSFHNTMEPSNASTSDNHGTIGVVNNVVGSDQQEITEDGGNSRSA